MGNNRKIQSPSKLQRFGSAQYNIYTFTHPAWLLDCRPPVYSGRQLGVILIFLMICKIDHDMTQSRRKFGIPNAERIHLAGGIRP